MDSSITRRGQLCWYRQDGVGRSAVNDVLLMEGAVFQIIRRRFRTEPFYIDLNDLMREVCHVCPFSMSH
jgi:farnesyl diphosphate synthase